MKSKETRIEESALEQAMSFYFGLEMTEEEILAQRRRDSLYNAKTVAKLGEIIETLDEILEEGGENEEINQETGPKED